MYHFSIPPDARYVITRGGAKQFSEIRRLHRIRARRIKRLCCIAFLLISILAMIAIPTTLYWIGHHDFTPSAIIH